MTALRPLILVISPMPAMPTSAGNRRRLLATCDFLKASGFDIDFAYVAHEDQIYRRFNQHPPTNIDAMAAYFRRVYFIECAAPIRLKTGANSFGIDDWCPPEVDAFVRAYFASTPETGVILVNYVWLSRALEAAPETCLKLIDAHDRFSDRKAQYLPFRAEANFFHTDAAGEALGLARADLVIAIQRAEQEYFSGITGRPTALLLPEFEEMRLFVAPKALKAIGFLGHGNDANLLSIGRFAGLWSKRWRPGWPQLVIAGEICGAMPSDLGAGVKLYGYVKRLEDFFDAVDLVVAPILFGTGLKMKVVEALSYGMPVVGTPQAFEGIDTCVPEHQLHDLDEMIDRIIVLAADAGALATLCTASAAVFLNYRARAADASAQLAIRLRRHCGSHAAVSPPMAPQVVTSSAPGEGDQALASLPADSSTLIATEFRPFTEAELESASPLRQRWYITDADRLEPVAAAGLVGRRVSLSPLVTAAATNRDDQRASDQAIEALALAEADWNVTAERFAISSDTIRVVFAGPSFLLKSAIPVRVFAIDNRGRAYELCAVKILHLARAPLAASPPRPNLTTRCGDAPVFTLAITGEWDEGRGPGRVAAVVVVAHALLGRVVNPETAIDPDAFEIEQNKTHKHDSHPLVGSGLLAKAEDSLRHSVQGIGANRR